MLPFYTRIGLYFLLLPTHSSAHRQGNHTLQVTMQPKSANFSLMHATLQIFFLINYTCTILCLVPSTFKLP